MTLRSDRRGRGAGWPSSSSRRGRRAFPPAFLMAPRHRRPWSSARAPEARAPRSAAPRPGSPRGAWAARAGVCLFVCLGDGERERERGLRGQSRAAWARARDRESGHAHRRAFLDLGHPAQQAGTQRERERGGVVRVCLVRARLIFLSHFLGDPIRPRSTPQKKQARNARREFFPTRGFATTGLDGEKAFLEVHMHMGPLKRRNGEARD